MKYYILILFTLLTSCNPKHSEPFYLGHWKMNVTHAVEQDRLDLEKSSSLNKEMKLDVLKNSKIIAESTTLIIDDEKMIINVTGSSRNYPYKVITSTSEKIIIEYEDKKTIRLTLEYKNGQLIITDSRPRSSIFDRI